MRDLYSTLFFLFSTNMLFHFYFIKMTENSSVVLIYQYCPQHKWQLNCEHGHKVDHNILSKVFNRKNYNIIQLKLLY